MSGLPTKTIGVLFPCLLALFLYWCLESAGLWWVSGALPILFVSGFWFESSELHRETMLSGMEKKEFSSESTSDRLELT